MDANSFLTGMEDPGPSWTSPRINSTNESIQAAMSISDHAQLLTSTPELMHTRKHIPTKKRKQVDEGRRAVEEDKNSRYENTG